MGGSLSKRFLSGWPLSTAVFVQGVSGGLCPGGFCLGGLSTGVFVPLVSGGLCPGEGSLQHMGSLFRGGVCVQGRQSQSGVSVKGRGSSQGGHCQGGLPGWSTHRGLCLGGIWVSVQGKGISFQQRGVSVQGRGLCSGVRSLFR